MRWRGEGGKLVCRVSDLMTAKVFESDGRWFAEVVPLCGGFLFGPFMYSSEAAAKAAVCHWIGKTMAQFSNALAAGCNEVPDDGN